VTDSEIKRLREMLANIQEAFDEVRAIRQNLGLTADNEEELEAARRIDAVVESLAAVARLSAKEEP
jgi:hypothetical protein